MTKRKVHQAFRNAYLRAHRGGKRIRHYRFNTGQLEALMDTGEAGHTKKGKHHEAHLIPGVDGRRIWGFPNSIITKMRYCDSFNFTSTSGIPARNVFAANGIFDPDITNAGHQPMYRDTFAGIYDQYVVIGSKIRCWFSPVTTSTTASIPTVVGIVGDDDATSSTNPSVLMEQNNSVHRMLGTPGCPPVELVLTFEPLEMFGVDAKDDGSSATAVSANPGELWTYIPFVFAADQSSTVTVSVAFEIEYTVKFTELQTPSLS